MSAAVAERVSCAPCSSEALAAALFFFFYLCFSSSLRWLSVDCTDRPSFAAAAAARAKMIETVTRQKLFIHTQFCFIDKCSDGCGGDDESKHDRTRFDKCADDAAYADVTRSPHFWSAATTAMSTAPHTWSEVKCIFGCLPVPPTPPCNSFPSSRHSQSRSKTTQFGCCCCCDD